MLVLFLTIFPDISFLIWLFDWFNARSKSSVLASAKSTFSSSLAFWRTLLANDTSCFNAGSSLYDGVAGDDTVTSSLDSLGVLAATSSLGATADAVVVELVIFCVTLLGTLFAALFPTWGEDFPCCSATFDLLFSSFFESPQNRELSPIPAYGSTTWFDEAGKEGESPFSNIGTVSPSRGCPAIFGPPRGCPTSGSTWSDVVFWWPRALVEDSICSCPSVDPLKLSFSAPADSLNNTCPELCDSLDWSWLAPASSLESSCLESPENSLDFDSFSLDSSSLESSFPFSSFSLSTPLRGSLKITFPMLL